MIFGLPWFYFLLAVIVGILGTGRLIRLAVNDTWPPILWFRDRWQTWTAQTERRAAWEPLFTCGWCLSPWITLANGAWAVLSNVHWTWWAFNGWMAVSYVASWLWFHDEDGDEAHGNGG
jgi:hypothetical protein